MSVRDVMDTDWNDLISILDSESQLAEEPLNLADVFGSI
nr:MAG TPA: hypothetical protein [Caudoviricetes sp.]